MKINIREMTLVSIFTGLTALGAFISIPLGPVPITMQTLFVLLGGILLGPRLGALSQIVYIILGLIGVPIFAGLSGGFQTILKPSFGFLLGFVFAAYIVGKIVHKYRFTKLKILIRVFISSLIGTISIYLIGLPYMYFILNNVMNMGLSIIDVIKLGCLLFLPGDLLKMLIAIFVGTKILPMMSLRT